MMGVKTRELSPTDKEMKCDGVYVHGVTKEARERLVTAYGAYVHYNSNNIKNAFHNDDLFLISSYFRQPQQHT